jgi:site-specific DNA-methyltransferase (adenine-specific)
MELMKLLLHGDCLEKLKLLKENSIDSIVTDPPYGLSFMNKKWDYDVPSTDIWIECLRVLKPGGHLLSFSGSRTYHRMAVRIEDAGFEIRDQIMWVYGSGFPKSHNIGKAVDKLQGNEREVVGTSDKKSFESWADFTEREFERKDNNITKGTSEWEGWGTALKPSHEPIVMARKPLSEKTVAENVLRWGTGGLNIDESRIGTDDNLNGGAYSKGDYNTDGKVLELGLKRQE